MSYGLQKAVDYLAQFTSAPAVEDLARFILVARYKDGRTEATFHEAPSFIALLRQIGDFDITAAVESALMFDGLTMLAMADGGWRLMKRSSPGDAARGGCEL
jgi:hypothetical protein